MAKLCIYVNINIGIDTHTQKDGCVKLTLMVTEAEQVHSGGCLQAAEPAKLVYGFI